MAIINTGEWHVRGPPQKDTEKPNQNNVTHVQLSPEAMMDLELKDGHICRLWKADMPDVKYEGIAWTCNQKPTINYNVALFYETFRKRCAFELKDRICISAGGPPPVAESVCLREIPPVSPVAINEWLPLSEEDKFYWEWILNPCLRLAGHIFTGMKISGFTAHREKRFFRIESINGQTNFLARFSMESPPKICIFSESESGAVLSKRPRLAVEGIAGIDLALERLNKNLASFEQRKPSRTPSLRRGPAILLSGPKGTGKTMIMEKIENLRWERTFRVKPGMKPSDLQQIFEDAKRQSSIILMDRLDSLVSKENFRSLTENDVADALRGTVGHQILCIAATSKPNELPEELLEFFDLNQHIRISAPTATSRKQIIRSLVSESLLSDDIVESLGDRTHAYVGRDLKILLQEAYEFFAERLESLGLDENDENQKILQEDIEKALNIVRPSAMRDVILETPKVRWDKIGGQEMLKKALRRVIKPSNPEFLKRYGITPTKGLLLYGPPGCSKTLSAQAMATEASQNFFAVKGAELLNMYVGESERQVREIFSKARAASPSIIFFDEIESIGSKREGSRSNGINVLTTLLNEMDGIEPLKDVTVLAATNQPEALDLALLRPGRFDKLIYVGPPNEEGRLEILKIQKGEREFAESVDIEELAKKTDGYSGAELVSICQKAAEITLEEASETGVFREIGMEEFEKAIGETKRQITEASVRKFEEWASGSGSERKKPPTSATKRLVSSPTPCNTSTPTNIRKLDARGRIIQEMLVLIKEQRQQYGKENYEEFVSDVLGGIDEALIHVKEKKQEAEEEEIPEDYFDMNAFY